MSSFLGSYRKRFAEEDGPPIDPEVAKNCERDMGPTKGPQESETNHGVLSKTAERQHPQGGRECGRPGGADKIRKESGCPT